ncbi:MAG TPA: DUF1232 domain-containing protein [Gemmatimonadaceae bacterium]|nr:DUF1232 domain-containing protein [Gemmatimonadaceae bacterium]
MVVTARRRRRRNLEEDRPARAPRAGAKRTVVYYIKQLPNFLRLLSGLIADPRVALIDKLLVFGAVVYIVTPIDLIPDFIPFLGEVDDIYLLVLALQRLISHAGRMVLLDHWHGDAEDLADLNLRHALAAAAFFLPRRIRRRLRVIGRA